MEQNPDLSKKEKALQDFRVSNPNFLHINRSGDSEITFIEATSSGPEGVTGRSLEIIGPTDKSGIYTLTMRHGKIHSTEPVLDKTDETTFQVNSFSGKVLDGVPNDILRIAEFGLLGANLMFAAKQVQRETPDSSLLEGFFTDALETSDAAKRFVGKDTIKSKFHLDTDIFAVVNLMRRIQTAYATV